MNPHGVAVVVDAGIAADVVLEVGLTEIHPTMRIHMVIGKYLLVKVHLTVLMRGTLLNVAVVRPAALSVVVAVVVLIMATSEKVTVIKTVVGRTRDAVELGAGTSDMFFSLQLFSSDALTLNV